MWFEVVILAIALFNGVAGFHSSARPSALLLRPCLANWGDSSWKSLLISHDRGDLSCSAVNQCSLGVESHRGRITNAYESSKTARRLFFISISAALGFLRKGAKLTFASGTSFTAKQASRFSPIQGMLIWCSLFILSATMHSAEAAMTKISPFRAREIAEEEGKGSPFQTLSTNLTQLLSTILVTTTTLSIYSTALFIQTISEAFPTLSLPFVTALLTMITLFFGELLPKAIAVSNSELVARKTVKSISRLATLLYPITTIFKKSSDFVLRLGGLRSIEDNSVSEDMLRMVVKEAINTENDGIEGREGRMIKAVLDMEETIVSKIMRPRVEIDSCSESSSLAELLELVIQSKYSRIPVYRGDVDNIVGVVFSKDLLDYVKLVKDDDDNNSNNNNNVNSAPANGFFGIGGSLTPTGQQFAQALNSTTIISPTYFIPETMTTWNALEEMRKRRVHMAIVVDEYGGTSGLVTFEDILEEVIGEIYDEDDDQEDVDEDATIFLKEQGVFELKGNADLDDVYEALGMTTEEVERFNAEQRDISTIGGLLCSEAGEIPQVGYTIPIASYDFTVENVEDGRKILLLKAVKARSIDGEESELFGDGNWSGVGIASGNANNEENTAANNDSKADANQPGVDALEGEEEIEEDSGAGEGGGDKVWEDGEWVERAVVLSEEEGIEGLTSGYE